MSRLLLASSAFSSETLRSARGVEGVREKQGMVMVLRHLEIEMMSLGGGVIIVDVGVRAVGGGSYLPGKVK